MNETTTAIATTCQHIQQNMPMFDSIIAVLKSQGMQLFIVFGVLPLIITLLFRVKIGGTKNLSKSMVKDQLLLIFFITQLLSFITYLVITSYDFQMFRNLISSII